MLCKNKTIHCWNPDDARRSPHSTLCLLLLLQPLLSSPECVLVLAETGALAVHAVLPRRTHPVATVRPAEARLTQTRPVDVVAAAVGALAHALTVLAVRAGRALLVAPERSERGVRGESCCSSCSWC